jgi:hypothetical protein
VRVHALCHVVHVKDHATRVTKGPVLLVGGIGTRATIFDSPCQTQPTLVDALLAQGYDVWIEEWRNCYDEANDYSLDDVAVFDHPSVVQAVCAITKSSTIKALVYCLGSVSFFMAVAAGLVPQVTTIVSVAVSLHPVVPYRTRLKAILARRIVALLTPYMDPRWSVSVDAPSSLLKLLTWVVHRVPEECPDPVCRMASFSYGVAWRGRSVVVNHAQISDSVHDWLRRQWTRVPLRVLEQVQRGWQNGHMVRIDNALTQVPADYLTDTSAFTSLHLAFLVGDRNNVFLPMSQQRTAAALSERTGRKYNCYIVPDYGHLDIFLGTRAHKDVYPLMLSELEK